MYEGLVSLRLSPGKLQLQMNSSMTRTIRLQHRSPLHLEEGLSTDGDVSGTTGITSEYSPIERKRIHYLCYVAMASVKSWKGEEKELKSYSLFRLQPEARYSAYAITRGNWPLWSYILFNEMSGVVDLSLQLALLYSSLGEDTMWFWVWSVFSSHNTWTPSLAGHAVSRGTLRNC